MGKEQSLGVIIVRFQVDDLHEGHLDVFQEANQVNDKLLIIIGLSPCMCTANNALDFNARRFMLQEKYPKAMIAYVHDTKSDIDWSEALDAVIAKYGNQFSKITLYGGRDSFIKGYKTKKYPTVELVQRVVISGTEIRKRIAAQSQNSREFRAGAIWYALNQYPRAIPTVDIAIINRDKDLILLGKKPKEEGYRLVGGFVQPAESWEVAAAREAKEETSLSLELRELVYEGSFPVDDWRYRGEIDKITTTMFSVFNWSGTPKPGDDICALEWFSLDKNILQNVVEEHIPLVLKLISKY